MSSLIIAVLVDRAMERRLSDALPFVHFATFQNWVELAFYDLEATPLAFIVDPLLVDRDHQFGLFRHLGRQRGVPVILYARMTPRLAPTLLLIGRMGIRHIMLRGVDDPPHRIRLLLAAAVGSRLQAPPPARP